MAFFSKELHAFAMNIADTIKFHMNMQAFSSLGCIIIDEEREAQIYFSHSSALSSPLLRLCIEVSVKSKIKSIHLI